MASILNVDQINNAAGTSAIDINSSSGLVTFPNSVTIPNGATMPAGSVVQVTPISYSNTQYTTGSTSWVALATPTLTMTPKYSTSKIHVIWQVNVYHVATHGISTRLLEGSTVVWGSANPSYETYHGNSDTYHQLGHTADLSAGSTNARTYSLQWIVYSGTSSAIINVGGLQSWMYAMEIAQ